MLDERKKITWLGCRWESDQTAVCIFGQNLKIRRNQSLDFQSQEEIKSGT